MCDKQCSVRYGMLTNEVRQSSNVTVDRACMSFLAINKGDVVARVNGIELLPALTAGQTGEQFGIDGNEGEVYTDGINVTFASTAGNPLVVVIQKFYKA